MRLIPMLKLLHMVAYSISWCLTHIYGTRASHFACKTDGDLHLVIVVKMIAAMVVTMAHCFPRFRL